MPADSLPQGASPFRVLNMTGNAWEWCNDDYAPYPPGQAIDPNPMLPAKDLHQQACAVRV